MRTIITLLAFFCLVCPALAQTPMPPKLMQEACALVSQQRNSLADAITVSEAQRKLDHEEAAKTKQRVAEWEEYFKSYTGEPPK